MFNGEVGAQGITGPTAPVIGTMWADQAPVAPGGTVVVNVTAWDPAGESLTYTWTVAPGWSITGGQGTASVQISAPTIYAATGTAEVRIADAEGNQAYGALVLLTLGNERPVIRSLAIWPQPIEMVGTFWADAEDDFDTALDYLWSVGGVTVATGSEAVWQSPGLAGNFLGAVVVTDGAGLSSSARFSLAMKGANPHAVGRGDVQRTGRSPYAALVTGAIKWATPITNGTSFGEAAIGSNGLVYTGTQEGNVYALRSSNGSVAWTHPAGGAIVATPVLQSDGTVVVATRKGKLVGLDADSGAEKWATAEVYQEFFSSPIVGADGSIYVGSFDNHLYAFSATGNLRWAYATGDRIFSSPALAPDGTIYVASYDQQLYAIHPDGTLRWSAELGPNSRSGLAVGPSGTIYVSTGVNNKVHAFDPSGIKRWEVTLSTGSFSALAIGHDETIYVSHDLSMLTAIRRDGTLRWSFVYGIGGFGDSSPLVGADGRIYLGDYGKFLYAVNPDGSIAWQHDVGGLVTRSPSIGRDGVIYIPTSNGLVALR